MLPITCEHTHHWEDGENDNVPFLNYGDDERFQKPEYLQDASHLNDTGAKEFSKEITNVLKN